MTDDDRTERAFRDAFRTHADAFEPEVLSPSPVRRARRAWPAVLLAAAAVLVLAVGTLVWRSSGSDHPTPAVGSDVTLPNGWRWESHADVEVAVPESWGYAAAPHSDWCAATGRHRSQAIAQEGYVDTSLSGDGVLAIGCGGTPPAKLTALHLSFVDEGTDSPMALPPGWTTVGRSLGATRMVVTTDAAHRVLADRILATAHLVRTDQNGCAVASPIQDQLVDHPSPAFDVDSVRHVDSIAVCQYELDVTGPGLVASQLLTGTAADDELAALQTAPAQGGPDRLRQCNAAVRGPTGSTLLLTSGGQSHQMYAFYSGCARNGIDDGTTVRALTRSDCPPLWSPRIRLTDGLSAVFDRCRPPG
jgi:hypothetical protein